MEEKNTRRDFMYKYKKIVEKAPNRRFRGVFTNSLIIVRGAPSLPSGSGRSPALRLPSLYAGTPAAAGQEPAEPAAEAAAGEHKKKIAGAVGFSTVAGVLESIFCYFLTIIE